MDGIAEEKDMPKVKVINLASIIQLVEYWFCNPKIGVQIVVEAPNFRKERNAYTSSRLLRP